MPKKCSSPQNKMAVRSGKGLLQLSGSRETAGKGSFFTVYDSSEKKKSSAPGEDTHVASEGDITEEARETSRTSEPSDASETSGQMLLSHDSDIAKTDPATDTEASADAKISAEENTLGPQQETSTFGKIAGFLRKYDTQSVKSVIKSNIF